MKAITLNQRMDKNHQFQRMNTPIIKRMLKRIISVKKRQMQQ